MARKSKAKSRYTRKSAPRPRSYSRKSTRKSVKYSAPSLTADQKLNIIGGALLILGLLGLLAPFTDKNGPFTGWIARTIGQIAGWGGIIIPVILIILGITLLLRYYENLPRVSGGRIGGALLLYLNLLAWFHFFNGGGITSARAGVGGGFIGFAFDQLLSRSLGKAGEVLVLIAWLLIAFIFLFDISLPDLARRIAGFFSALKRPRSYSQPHLPSISTPARTTQPEADDLEPLPEGFKPIDVTGHAAQATRAQAVRARREPQPATAASSTAPARNTASAPFVAEPTMHTAAVKPLTPWPLPAVADILEPATQAAVQSHYDKDRGRIIEETLASFGAPGHIVEIQRGPAITQYGVEPDFIESRGGRTRVRVSRIAGLVDDLALALAAPSIRIQAPVPGKAYIGIEVPNTELTLVSLRELVETEVFRKLKTSLRFAFGKDVSGRPVVADLPSMPHLLIAGTTNSGKSVLVNAILTSLLLHNTPADLRLVLVDPKRVELTGYNGIPHLLAPVIVEAERVAGALQWVIREMESRYKRFSDANARNIVEFNKKNGEQVPYLVIVIDELADLMMLAPEETERSITRLSQMARATGIHLIISTQRPSVDVVTGLIKANFPARVAFMVASQTDSRVILDQPGAERLLGRGDMLFQAPDAPAPVRLQGVYVSDAEIQRLVNAWRQIAAERRTAGEEQPRDMSFEMLPAGTPLKQGSFFGDPSLDGDPMVKEAIAVVRSSGKASVSMLQRHLRVGYNRAARLIDTLEDMKIIGPQEAGMQLRQVLDYGDSTAHSSDPD